MGKSREERLEILITDLKDAFTRPARIIKCPVDAVTVFDPPVEFDDYLTNRIAEAGGWRYAQPCLLRAYPVAVNPEREPDVVSPISEAVDDERHRAAASRSPETSILDGEVTATTRKTKTIFMERKEEQLVDRFRIWLRDEKNIPLTDSPKEEDFVDLNFQYKADKYMVEAKYVHNSVVQKLHRALGQVLYYNLYPGTERRDYWLILLNRKPSKQVLAWLQNMRDRFVVEEFPVYLCWEGENTFDGESVPLFQQAG